MTKDLTNYVLINVDNNAGTFLQHFLTAKCKIIVSIM